jgi:hypothetical protein
MAGDISLFRRDDWTRLWRDEVKESEELQEVSLAGPNARGRGAVAYGKEGERNERNQEDDENMNWCSFNPGPERP